jgi:hypothetical protein
VLNSTKSVDAKCVWERSYKNKFNPNAKLVINAVPGARVLMSLVEKLRSKIYRRLNARTWSRGEPYTLRRQGPTLVEEAAIMAAA